MSRWTFASLLGEAVCLAAVVFALGACAGARPPPAPAPPPGTPGTAEHVYLPLRTPSPSGAAAQPTIAPQTPFSDPRLIALAKADAVCNFDWRQSLATRVAQARTFATAAYALTLGASTADAANWQITQQHREYGACYEA